MAVLGCNGLRCVINIILSLSLSSEAALTLHVIVQIPLQQPAYYAARGPVQQHQVTADTVSDYFCASLSEM
jgi:hypothetical protein